ncbi:MAG: disulfide bond formation protein B [Candidatus Absconditabacteria bacterium]|nr:disulfide bond formation protein B [Candidatus Absconditabacteria bacterium]MDD3868253.1 disulfide bond formation protein B [Candidatus Absconditabacteria bacterium]MDD4714619.1 disulfide bond formation protein B [Candidatus Absconditabacteria bacterium]
MKNQPLRLGSIFVVSALATFGSLYFGYFGDPILNLQTGELFNPENGFNICNLCRYARILMYPIFLLSLFALIFKDGKIWKYILPLTILGIILEIYQNYVLYSAVNSFMCAPDNPCTVPYLNYFGFITIPLLCLIAFILIGFACIGGMKENNEEGKVE